MLDVLAPKKTAIVGAWQGAISLNGSRILFTFNSDGTAYSSHQGEVSTAPRPPVVVTPLHGVWTHLGGNQFGATLTGIIYDSSTDELKGSFKVRLLLTINEAGDELSVMDRADFLGPNGNEVAALPPGNTTYKRIQFEPFN